MRMLLKVSVPTEQGNQAIKDGRLPQVLEQVIGSIKPEAAYFFTENGERGGIFVFDMTDSSQIPAIAEPLYQQLSATVQFYPVMNQEDLTRGLTTAAQNPQ